MFGSAYIVAGMAGFAAFVLLLLYLQRGRVGRQRSGHRAEGGYYRGQTLLVAGHFRDYVGKVIGWRGRKVVLEVWNRDGRSSFFERTPETLDRRGLVVPA